jgi:hypothetical protein
MDLSNTQNKFKDIKDNQEIPQVCTVVLIKQTVKQFITGQEVFYSVVSEKGEHLALFDTIKACKHFATTNEYRYEFVH